MKAYEVRDAEDCCVIEFAEHAATARRNGAAELNIAFEEVESCIRAPWADQYAPGPVPLDAYLAQGWRFECDHCGAMFSADGRDDEDDEREDDFSPVEDGQYRRYCSHTCLMQDWAEHRDRVARENAAIDATALRWPQATNIKAARKNGRHGLTAIFHLPGIKYGVEQDVGASVAMVAQADLDEFGRLYGIKEGCAA